MSEISQPPILEIRDAAVAALREPSLMVVEKVNWTILPAEFWVVAGQQYSGKSDLLMLGAGLMNPAGGSCRVFGCETASFGEAQLAERLRVGFVFQGGQLFNRLTIAENVALPLRYQKDWTPEQAAESVKTLLDILELSPIADLTPPNVAASWRLRAALARTLILKPELLLLDNPLHGLGARHRQWLLHFLDQLWRGHEFFGGRPLTLIVSTEDLRPWQNARRKFALLHEKKFMPLGFWTEIATTEDPIVKELLAEPEEISAHG
ncbi:MAG TPA: ATP-binding cassette domain-containing protein [Verrucomicrobiae bacterium]|nr:ATP-binding cassette domain-containing protein [Verrucomicrobiae bacterium]